MPDHPDPSHVHAPPDATALARIAAELVGAGCTECPEPPFLLALTSAGVSDIGRTGAPGDLGTDVEVLPLGPSTNPVALLCHQLPKPGWVAAGVMVNGWTVPREADVDIDWRTMTPTTRLSMHPARRSVRTLHLVSRGGAVALAMHQDRAHLPEVNATDEGDAAGGPCGPLPDSLRRLFGLATPPSPVSALELWASVWLHAVAVDRQRRGGTWAAVARAHPAAGLLEDADMKVTPENLIVAGRALAIERSWDALQLRAVTGGTTWSFLPPSDVAAWADAGMFARLVLRNVNPLWASRHDLVRVVPPGLLGLVDDVLAAWELDSSPPGRRSAA